MQFLLVILIFIIYGISLVRKGDRGPAQDPDTALEPDEPVDVDAGPIRINFLVFVAYSILLPVISRLLYSHQSYGPDSGFLFMYALLYIGHIAYCLVRSKRHIEQGRTATGGWYVLSALAIAIIGFSVCSASFGVLFPMAPPHAGE